MTSLSFREALNHIGMNQRAFAVYIGANERTVRRWVLGEQDIPAWIPVMLTLIGRCLARGISIERE